MSQTRARLVAPAVLLVLFVAAYFGYFIRPGLVDQSRSSLMSSWDYQSYFLPRFIHGSRTLLGGQLPLWNRFEAGGLPFLATTQPAVFYPPKVLFYGLLGPNAAEWGFLVFHYLLAAAGGYFFFVDSGFTGVSAFAGTATWLFSIPLLSSNYHPTRIASLVWMPLVFALSKRAAHGSRRALAAIALVVALQLCAGYPEFSLDLALVVGIHAVASWAFGDWPAPPWRTGPLLAGAFLLGALGAAIQLLPLAEIAAASKRLDLADAEVAMRNLAPNHGTPILLTAPAMFGFAVVSLLTRRARPALIGSFACFIMGNWGWKVLRYVPGFGMVRFPFVWLYFAAFYFAWTAALGCDAVIRGEGLPGRRRTFAAWLLAANGVLLVAGWAVAWRRLGSHGAALPWSPNVTTPLAGALGIAAGVVLLAAAVVWLVRRSLPVPALLALCALAIAAHLAAFPFGAMPAPFGRPFDIGEVAEFDATHGHFSGRALSTDDILYGYPLTDRKPSPLSVENSFLPYRQRRITERFGYFAMLGVLDWYSVSRARGYLDAMDVEIIAAPSGFDGLLADAGLFLVRSVAGKSFFENPAHLGHAWVNFAVRRARSEDDALDFFLGPTFDPRREVLLEAPTRREYPAPDTETPDAMRPNWEQRYSDSSVEWQVDLPRPGIFVASESAYPGWAVTVDGRAAEWFVADYCLRGVELRSGQHRVRFDYRPKFVAWGRIVSLLALAGTLFLLFAPDDWLRRSS
jgi:hypothetical protein